MKDLGIPTYHSEIIHHITRQLPLAFRRIRFYHAFEPPLRPLHYLRNRPKQQHPHMDSRRSPSLAPIIVPVPKSYPVSNPHLPFCAPPFPAASKPSRRQKPKSAFGKSDSPAHFWPTNDNCPPTTWGLSSSSSLYPFYPACVR